MDTLMTDADVDALATSLTSIGVRATRPPSWRLQFDTIRDAQDARARLTRMWGRDGTVCTTSVEPTIHKRHRKTVWILNFSINGSARNTYDRQRDLSDCRRYLRITYGDAVLGKI